MNGTVECSERDTERHRDAHIFVEQGWENSWSVSQSERFSSCHSMVRIAVLVFRFDNQPALCGTATENRLGRHRAKMEEDL